MLIDNWKAAPRMLVVQTLAIIAIVQIVWAELPPDLVAELPPKLVHWITIGLTVAGIVARVVKQEGLEAPADEAPKEGGFARPGLLLAMAASLLIGCSTLGVPQPQTFNQRAATAITSVTSVRQTATVLLQAGKLTPEDARNVQAQADNAMAAIAIARNVSTTDPAGGQTKLTAALTILQALDAYLASRSQP